MTAPFTITAEPARRRLVLVLSGFWDVATVDAYGAALRAAMDEMVASVGRFGILSDASAMPVQSRDVAEAQAQLVASLADRRAPTAIVVDQMLNKMQADRMAGETAGIRTFRSRAEAEAWLDDRLQETT